MIRKKVTRPDFPRKSDSQVRGPGFCKFWIQLALEPYFAMFFLLITLATVW